jgi:hypothetical protein
MRASASMQNHQITKLPNIKLQSYKLHVPICKFQNFKVLKNIAIICFQIYKNYQITIITIIVTNSQFDKLQVCIFQVHKFALVCKITKLPKSPKLQGYKLQVHFFIFISLHMLNLHIFILACTTKL